MLQRDGEWIPSAARKHEAHLNVMPPTRLPAWFIHTEMKCKSRHVFKENKRLHWERDGLDTQSVCGFGCGPKRKNRASAPRGGNRETHKLSAESICDMNVRVTGLVQSVIRSEEKNWERNKHNMHGPGVEEAGAAGSWRPRRCSASAASGWSWTCGGWCRPCARSLWARWVACETALSAGSSHGSWTRYTPERGKHRHLACYHNKRRVTETGSSWKTGSVRTL